MHEAEEHEAPWNGSPTHEPQCSEQDKILEHRRSRAAKQIGPTTDQLHGGHLKLRERETRASSRQVGCPGELMHQQWAERQLGLEGEGRSTEGWEVPRDLEAKSPDSLITE